MFIIELTYLKPIDDVCEKLEEHKCFLQKYYAQNKFICSGPKNPRTGGFILAKANRIDEVKAIISEDPFLIYNLAEYKITEFIENNYASGFEKFI